MVLKEDIKSINDIIQFVMGKSCRIDNTCLYSSALLYSLVKDNTHLNPKLVAGSLKLNDGIIFSNDPILPVISSGQDFSGNWNGHAWVEVDELILDASIFMTIKSKSTPHTLQQKFDKIFKGKPDYLIGSRSLLEQSGLFYKSHEEFSNFDATVLLNSGYKAGFIYE